jgi:hypothetical protein
MKYKDFLTKLKENGKINQAEFLAAIESAPDAEFPDKAFEAFENSFLTLDRATSHPEVNTKLRAELLDPVDRDIHKLLEFDLKEYFDHTKINELKGEKSTYKKLSALGPALSEVIKKVKAAPATDEETKKKLVASEATVQELLAKIEGINSEYSNKEKTIQSEFEKKLHDYKLDGELEKMANSFKFADKYSEEELRDLTKIKLDKIKGEHSLSLVETDGQRAINVLDKDGKPKFNGNSAVTINNLLEESLKPYLKVNNVDDKRKDSQETHRFKVDDNNPTRRQGSRTTVQ